MNLCTFCCSYGYGDKNEGSTVRGSVPGRMKKFQIRSGGHLVLFATDTVIYFPRV